MDRIDSAILDLTEWCCRKFQVLTGRTNVWLAVQITNLSIVLYFVWAATFFVVSEFATRVVVALFCAGLLYLLTQTVFKVSIEASEGSAYQRVAKGYRNPRRVRDAMLRILFLMLCVVMSGPSVLFYLIVKQQFVLLSYSLIVLTTILLYVVACDPLPPCAGKLKEWIRDLTLRRVPATTSPAVAPPPRGARQFP